MKQFIFLWDSWVPFIQKLMIFWRHFSWPCLNSTFFCFFFFFNLLLWHMTSQTMHITSHSLPCYCLLRVTKSLFAHCLLCDLTHHAQCTLRRIQFYPNSVLLFSPQISVTALWISWVGLLPNESGSHLDLFGEVPGRDRRGNSRTLLLVSSLLCEGGSVRATCHWPFTASPNLLNIPSVISVTTTVSRKDWG